MPRLLFLIALVALTAGCKPQTPSPKGRVAEMLQSNAKLVGYVYSADQPNVVVAFDHGMLRWRSDPQRQSVAEGRAQVFNYSDRMCLGFEQKSAAMPARAPDCYLVCEATESIQHRNHLPRSQDFSFKRGDVFLEYEPPEGAGFAEIYYAGEEK
jgi:hypothetical protein